MFKKFIKFLFIVSIFFKSFIFAAEMSVVPIGIEQEIPNYSDERKEMLISFMEALMNGTMKAYDDFNPKFNYITFRDYSDPGVFYRIPTLYILNNLKTCKDMASYYSHKNNEINFDEILYMTLNAKLYIQSLRFFDFINCLDIVKCNSFLFKMFAKKYRRELIDCDFLWPESIISLLNCQLIPRLCH